MSILSHSEDSNKTTETAAVTATGTATATVTTADKYYHGGQVDDNVELSKTTASKTTRLLG